MMGRGDRLVLALTILLVVYSFVALLFVGLVISSLLYEPDQAPAVQFRTTAKDRPVLETPKQVWQARTTGIRFWRSVILTGNQTQKHEFNQKRGFWRSVILTGNQTCQSSVG